MSSEGFSLDTLYERLRQDAKEHGSAHGQVWHEADIDGHHLYMADTSFGDGPVFRFDTYGWQSPGGDWLPYTRGSDEAALAEALKWAAKAEWTYRLVLLQDVCPDCGARLKFDIGKLVCPEGHGSFGERPPFRAMKPFTNVRVEDAGRLCLKVTCLDTEQVRYVERNEEGDRYWTVPRRSDG